MKRSLTPLMMLALGLFVAPAAESSSVRVPQDVASIQLALDGSADTLLVAAGTYPERLTVSRDVVILGPEVFAEAPPVAVVQGATFTTPAELNEDIVVLVERMRWSGGVAFSRLVRASFESCWFDSGAAGPGIDVNHVAFRQCRFVGGGISGGFQALAVSDCRFERGGIDVFVFSPRILRNTVDGPTPKGIAVRGPPSDYGLIRHNRVRNVGVGISMEYSYVGAIEWNTVEDCEDVGISMGVAFGNPVVRHNLVRRCKSAGIYVGYPSTCDSNVVEHCGGDGIVGNGTLRGNQVRHVGGCGIRLTQVTVHLSGNVVMNARLDGVFASQSLHFASHNVVGHCGGHGIDAEAIIYMTRNTLFSNGGSGARSRGSGPPAVIRANIAASNRGYGFEYLGTATYPWDVGCNDWFMNHSGSTQGVPTSASDLDVDPRFCGAGHGDVRLRDSSPLASTACGPIGAGDVGCGGVDESGDRIVADPDLPMRPARQNETEPRLFLAGRPEHPSVVLSVDTPTTVGIIAYDVQGRVVARLASGVLEPGHHEFGPRSEGLSSLRSGVYFIRAFWPGGSRSMRLVLRQ